MENSKIAVHSEITFQIKIIVKNKTHVTYKTYVEDQNKKNVLWILL